MQILPNGAGISERKRKTKKGASPTPSVRFYGSIFCPGRPSIAAELSSNRERKGYRFNIARPCPRVVRGYRRKRYYSTPQRILTHLSSEESLKPDGLPTRTQEGIAETILCGRSTVTKWLIRLNRESLVTGARAHVPGHAVRKTVYDLTEKGWERAEQVRRRLASEVVEVGAPGLDPLSMVVSEIPVAFPAQVNLTLAVSLTSEGRLDLRRLAVRRVEAVSYLMWGENLPRPERIFGRGVELQALDKWLNSRSPILAVTGLAGIGKSALVAHWILQRRPKAHVFWHELRDSTTPSAFLNEIGTFLARLGRRAIQSHLAEKGRLDVDSVRRILTHDTGSLSLLIVLDGFERVRPETSRVLMATVFRLGSSSRPNIIVTSRILPRSLSRIHGGRPPGILRVRGLDPESSNALLRYKGWSGGDDAAARRMAAGRRSHPLLLHLAAQGGAAFRGTLARYLEDEVWGALTRSECALLEATSVFREAVPLRALQSFTGVTAPVLRNLRAKNLLEPTLTGRVSVHDMIREHVLRRLEGGRLRALHEEAAKQLLRSPQPRDRLEALHHLLQAGQTKRAADILDAEGASLLDSISVHDVALLLRGIDLERASPLSACVFSELLGDCLRILGHLGPALMQYAHASRRCEAAARRERIPRILRKMASIERARNRHPKALGYLVEARARLSQLPDPLESAEVLREMALVEQAEGNLGIAAGYLNESIDLATDSSDPGALARAFLALGTLEAQRGEMRRSLASKLQGLRIAERAGNLAEVARTHIGVGAAQAELGKLRMSLRHYEKALRLARLLGNLRLIAYATMNQSAALIDLGRFQDAGKPLREARRLAEILEERENLDILWIYEGNLERGLGHWALAGSLWERGLSALRDHGHPHDLVRVLREVGAFHVEHGDVEEGQAYLKEAAAIARRLGNVSLLKEIQGFLSRAGAGEARSLPAQPPDPR